MGLVMPSASLQRQFLQVEGHPTDLLGWPQLPTRQVSACSPSWWGKQAAMS